MLLSIRFHAGMHHVFSVVLIIGLIRNKTGEKGPRNQEFSLVYTINAEIAARRNCHESRARCYATFTGKNCWH